MDKGQVTEMNDKFDYDQKTTASEPHRCALKQEAHTVQPTQQEDE